MDGAAREELDNFLPCRFECRGVTWTSAEHCFQAAKFPHDPERAELVRSAASGGDAFTLANQKTVACRPDWERVKVEAMYQANLAKFSQNAELRAVLVASKGPITAFGFPFWAKWNAVLLERIREELRPPAERDGATLKARIATMEAIAAGQSVDPRPSGFGGTVRCGGRRPVPPRAAAVAREEPAATRSSRGSVLGQPPGAADGDARMRDEQGVGRGASSW